jgi:Domain of unknown function (DUF3883)
MLNPRHKALLDEVRRRIELASDDPAVLNRDGKTSWRGPRVRRAVEARTDDGPALVEYIRGVLRKRQSEGWNALREADRLQYSFEDMVANPPDPQIAGLFNDEDRELAMRLLGRKPTDPEIGTTREQDDILAAVHPRRAHPTRSHAERCAIEVRAVQAVKERLMREGWSVEDVGASRSYDLHCSADGQQLFVEVIGTTGPLSMVVLTANEVEIARRRHPDTALFVVHDIELSGGAESPKASGGTLRELRPWLPEESRLTPAVFSYRLDDQDEQPYPESLTSRRGTSESVRSDLLWQSRRFS